MKTKISELALLYAHLYHIETEPAAAQNELDTILTSFLKEFSSELQQRNELPADINEFSIMVIDYIVNVFNQLDAIPVELS